MNMMFFSVCLLLATVAALIFVKDLAAASPTKVVILLGPPGSGKGTQAVRLTKDLNIPHISTGDLFRENISKNTELGQKAKTFMNEGKLVPDSLVLDMLFARVSQEDSRNGYLLDGFPRTLPQAEAFDKQIKPGTELIVLQLDVPDELIVKRAAGRLTCKGCGNIHNRYFSPPLKEGICDKCGGELVQRPDDREEVVQERLRVYHTQTKPLVEYYSKKGILHKVDGTKTPDEVYQALKKQL